MRTQAKAAANLIQLDSTTVNPVILDSVRSLPLHQNIDVIDQLRRNVVLLKDLHARLGFMMKEIKGVLKA